MTNLPNNYQQQMDELARRLTVQLNPRSARERELIQWLRDSLGADSLVAFLAMAERTRGAGFERGRRDGFERGEREGYARGQREGIERGKREAGGQR